MIVHHPRSDLLEHYHPLFWQGLESTNMHHADTIASNRGEETEVDEDNDDGLVLRVGVKTPSSGETSPK